MKYLIGNKIKLMYVKIPKQYHCIIVIMAKVFSNTKAIDRIFEEYDNEDIENYKHDTQLIKELIELLTVEEINSHDFYGDNLGYLALKHEHYDILKLLIDKGLDPYIRNISFDQVTERNMTKKRYGISESSLFEESVKHDNHEIINYLINLIDTKVEDLLSNDRFIFYSTTGNITVVKNYIWLGIDINCKDSRGLTVLHRIRHLSVAKELIANGADVNLLCNNKYSPLWHIIKNFPKPDHLELCTTTVDDYTEITKLLIESGADVNFSSNGKSLLDLALELNAIEIANILVEYIK